jgi:steroid 5-alpha reductase family enzyme
MWTIYILAGLVILTLMIALWLLSLPLQDASIVDVFWGLGFAITAWLFFTLTPGGYYVRKGLLSLLVTV